MSLINDMLKDLEKRKAPETQANAIGLAPVSTKRSGFIRDRRWQFVSAVVVIVFVIFGFFQIRQQQHQNEVFNKTIMAAVTKTTEPKPTPTPAPVTPVAPKPQPKPPAPIVAPSVPKPAPTSTPVMVVAKPVPLTKAQQAGVAYRAVMAEYDEGSIPEAIQHLTQLVQDFPEYLPARITLIKYDLQQQNAATATTLLQAGFAIAPKDAELITLKAQLLASQGQTAAALTLLEQYFPDMKAYPDYYTLKAALYRQIGHNAEAAALYSQLISTHGSNPKWWLGLGLSLEAQGYTTAAHTAYQHVVSDLQASPELRLFAQEKLRADSGG